MGTPRVRRRFGGGGSRRGLLTLRTPGGFCGGGRRVARSPIYGRCGFDLGRSFDFRSGFGARRQTARRSRVMIAGSLQRARHGFVRGQFQFRLRGGGPRRGRGLGFGHGSRRAGLFLGRGFGGGLGRAMRQAARKGFARRREVADFPAHRAGGGPAGRGAGARAAIPTAFRGGGAGRGGRRQAGRFVRIHPK